jgi:bifunctional DNA-binding transcriptional regulator/antitoxin component of YhaV-PrlF toxin-antitoxin module
VDERIKNRRKGFTRISRQHQVTLPVEALAAAGLSAGDQLRATSPAPGKIVLERDIDPLTALAGDLTGVYEAGDLDRLRAEWE